MNRALAVFLVVGSSVFAACASETQPPVEPPPRTLYRLSVAVEGLAGQLILMNGDKILVLTSENGEAMGAFERTYSRGSEYDVQIASQPEGQHCELENAQGVLYRDSQVDVFCLNLPDETYRLRGQVVGSTGELRLRTGEVIVVIPGDGEFEFEAEFVAGTSYDVMVDQQPEGQYCEVDDASGTFSDADVNTVDVSCVAELEPSLGSLSFVDAELNPRINPDADSYRVHFQAIASSFQMRAETTHAGQTISLDGGAPVADLLDGTFMRQPGADSHEITVANRRGDVRTYRLQFFDPSETVLEPVDPLGDSVTIAYDDNALVVGVPTANDGEGEAFVYVRDEAGADHWRFVTALQPWYRSRQFGEEVAISWPYVIVGARGDGDCFGSEFTTFDFGDDEIPSSLPRTVCGSGPVGIQAAADRDAWLVIGGKTYNRVWSEASYQWEESTRLENEFGDTSVAVGPTTIVTGAPSANREVGAVKVYVARGSGEDRTWELLTELHGAVPEGRFGEAVAYDRRRSHIAIAAQNENAIYVFRPIAGDYEQSRRVIYDVTEQEVIQRQSLSIQNGRIALGMTGLFRVQDPGGRDVWRGGTVLTFDLDGVPTERRAYNDEDDQDFGIGVALVGNSLLVVASDAVHVYGTFTR